MICKAGWYLVALFWLQSTCAASSSDAAGNKGPPRRCIVNNTTDPRIQLSSVCESCRYPSVEEKNTPLAMIVIASDDPIKSPLLPVASQLVASHFRVAVVHVFGSNRQVKEDHVESILRQKITSSVPCSNVKSWLKFKWVPVKGINESVRLSSPYDALVEAEAEYQVLEFLVETDELPSVIVLEAANVGGQLVAEKLGIPSVLLAPHSMMALISEKTSPSTGLVDLFQRRKDSFLLANHFMKLNSLRQKYGLPLLRNPSDYFEKSTIVLINELAAPTANGILPLFAHFVSPLLPPCLPCQQTDGSTATILVLTAGLSMADTRTLIRGLSLARAYFQSIVDDTCHPDNPGADIHPEMCSFAESMAEFQVVWEVQNASVLPELPPTFLSQDSSPLLELLSSYPNTVAAITHCDSESYPIFALGQRIVCIPTSKGTLDTPRLGGLSGGGVASLESQSIASTLVDLLVESRDDSTTETALLEKEDAWYEVIDGGNLTAQIIETIAFAQRNETDESLREQVNERLDRSSQQKADIASLLVASCAWNVLFVISLGYCLRLIYVTADPGMTGQTKRFLRSPSVQVVFQYLEELDWALLFAEKFWWCDESMIHNRIELFLQRYEPVDDVVEANEAPRSEPKRETTGHNARRKRHTRKR